MTVSLSPFLKKCSFLGKGSVVLNVNCIPLTECALLLGDRGLILVRDPPSLARGVYSWWECLWAW